MRKNRRNSPTSLAWPGKTVAFPPSFVYTTKYERQVTPVNYTLMHKDIPVADLTLDEATGSIQRVDELLHGEHLPVGVPDRHGVADRTALNEWWEDRSIPASRSGLREALETLGVKDPSQFEQVCETCGLAGAFVYPRNGEKPSFLGLC